MSWFLLNQWSRGETWWNWPSRETETVGNGRKRSETVGSSRERPGMIMPKLSIRHLFYPNKFPSNPEFNGKLFASWGSYLWLGRGEKKNIYIYWIDEKILIAFWKENEFEPFQIAVAKILKQFVLRGQGRQGSWVCSWALAVLQGLLVRHCLPVPPPDPSLPRPQECISSLPVLSCFRCLAAGWFCFVACFALRPCSIAACQVWVPVRFIPYLPFFFLCSACSFCASSACCLHLIF